MTYPVIPTYPLQWPPSWKRTPYHSRSRAPFHKRTARQIGGGADGPIYHRAKETLAVGDGLARLDGELGGSAQRGWSSAVIFR